MSTFTGSITNPESDPSLQLAPAPDEGPDVNALQQSFTKAVTDSRSYIDQCSLNYQTRYAIWPGQTADGKKHAREGAKIDPTPWDGASDLRVYLTDNVILKKVAMLCMGLRKANLVAVPVEGNDIKRAKVVSNFMRWLIRTQIPGLDREEELLGNYLLEKGVAITGQFWEKSVQKTVVTVTVKDLLTQYPEMAKQIQELGGVDLIKDDMISLFEEIYGVSTKKGKRMFKELMESGQTSVVMTGKEKSYPVIRAFNLTDDIFFQAGSTDLESTPGIYRVQYYTPEQLRSFVNTDGWNDEWVEKAIKTCKGQLINGMAENTQRPVARNFIYGGVRHDDKIGVVYAYQRLSDEDGIPGIYLTIFNPNLPATEGDDAQPGYAKSGLFGDSGGEYPFVLHRREYLSRRIWDSRGVPEAGKPWQDQIKAHRDSRIDAASMRIIPPIFYPIGRAPSRWGPGSRIPERRPGEYHFGEGPPVDPVTDDSEDRLVNSFNDYYGLYSKDGQPQFSPLENQFEVDKWMTCWAKAYRQVLKLYKRFGSEEVFFRVVGLQNSDPVKFDKGDADEEFDIYLSYDVQSQDFERMTAKVTAMVQILQLDRNGVADWPQVLQIGMEAVDPNWAERVLQPVAVGTQQQINDLQSDFSKLSAGMNVNLKMGTPPQIAMQALQNWMTAPDVQQRLAQDEAFKARVEAFAKQVQMQQMQEQNKQIGRLGAQMPGPVIGQ